MKHQIVILTMGPNEGNLPYWSRLFYKRDQQGKLPLLEPIVKNNDLVFH